MTISATATRMRAIRPNQPAIAADSKAQAINAATVEALLGVWREDGGNDDLLLLNFPAVTEGMVVVAKRGENWRHRPEPRWQTWPDLLRPVVAEPDS